MPRESPGGALTQLAAQKAAAALRSGDVQAAFKKQGGFHPYKSERDYREKYEHALFERLFFTPGSPVIFVSAMSGYEIDRMLNAAVKLNRTLDKKLPTAKLNQVLGYLAERNPPAAIGGKRFRIYYATHTGTRPFRIKIFCNREEKLTEQYRRYLEAGVVEEFDIAGCSIYFDLVGRRLPRAQRLALAYWVLSHLPIALAITAAGAGLVSLIGHAHDATTPASTSWLLASAVATGLLALVLTEQALADAERLSVVFHPLRLALCGGAATALIVGWLRPAPWLLALLLVAVLSAVWFFAVSRFLRADAWGEP